MSTIDANMYIALASQRLLIMQGTLVDENGTTHCEILRKYEQIAAENTTLKFQVQDAITAIQQLQQDLDQTKQARDIEHDRAEMLHEIVEEREEECAEIANAAEEKQQVCTLWPALLPAIERFNRLLCSAWGSPRPTKPSVYRL